MVHYHANETITSRGTDGFRTACRACGKGRVSCGSTTISIRSAEAGRGKRSSAGKSTDGHRASTITTRHRAPYRPTRPLRRATRRRHDSHQSTAHTNAAGTDITRADRLYGHALRRAMVPAHRRQGGDQRPPAISMGRNHPLPRGKTATISTGTCPRRTPLVVPDLRRSRMSFRARCGSWREASDFPRRERMRS